MKLKGSDDNVNVEMKSSSYPDERFFGAYLYVVLPSPMQIDDTITLEIDGKEIDVEVETVPDVSENYLRKTGVTMGTGDHGEQVWRTFNWVHWLDYCPVGLQLSYAKGARSCKSGYGVFLCGKNFSSGNVDLQKKEQKFAN